MQHRAVIRVLQAVSCSIGGCVLPPHPEAQKPTNRSPGRATLDRVRALLKADGFDALEAVANASARDEAASHEGFTFDGVESMY